MEGQAKGKEEWNIIYLKAKGIGKHLIEYQWREILKPYKARHDT